jgi:hypothetical protein
MTIVDISESNPFRPPDWRWRRAVYLHGVQAKPHRRRDDRWTGLALRLVERLKAGGTPPGRRRTGRHVVLEQAHALVFADDPRNRWEAEARLLAGQEPAAIAACLGLSPDVIEAYEAIFFNVGDRLDAVDYVAAFALSHGLHSGIAQDDHGAIARLVGYHLGPEAIDALAGRWGWPSAARVAPRTAAESARMRRAVDFLIATLALPADGSDARILARLDKLVEDLGRSSAARTIGSVSTPVTVAGEPPSIADPTRRDEVPFTPAQASDSFSLATPWWFARLGLSTATPPLAAAC